MSYHPTVSDCSTWPATAGDLDVFLQRVGGENPINLTPKLVLRTISIRMFSPDGERIAFCSDRDGGGIFIMGATGESPRRVSDKRVRSSMVT